MTPKETLTPVRILKELLQRRWVTLEVNVGESDEPILQLSVDPGKESVRLSDLGASDKGEPDAILLQGSEVHGWHTLFVPPFALQGEVWTPLEGWKIIRQSYLFDSRSGRLRLNYPQNPVAKGWMIRPPNTRITFSF